MIKPPTPPEDAARIVARAMSQRPTSERGELLRELLAHTAAGLCLIESRADAAEAAYRLADAIVANPSPFPNRQAQGGR